jgi:O-antigen/teichoic acid export membrane protein
VIHPFAKLITDIWNRAKASRILRQSAKLATGTMAGRLVYLAALPLITRLYSPSTFGVFALIVALGTFVTALGTLKLDVAVMTLKGSVESGRFTAALLRTSVIFPLLAYVLLSVPASYFGLPFAIDATPTVFLAFVTAVGITGAVSVILRAWAIRAGEFSAVAYSAGLRVALQAALAILFGLLPINAQWSGGYLLATSVAVSDCLAIAMLCLAAGKRRRLQFFGVRTGAMLAALHRNRRIGSAISTSQFFNQITAQLPNIWMSWIFGPMPAGLFAFAQRVVFLPTSIVTGSVGTILVNTISGKHNRGGDVTSLIGKQLAFTSASGLVLFIPIALISYFHVGWLFGEEWRAAGPVVALMCILGFANMMITTNIYLPPLLGMKNFLFWSSSLRLFLQVATGLAAWLLQLTLHQAILVYALLELGFGFLQTTAILRAGKRLHGN